MTDFFMNETIALNELTVEGCLEASDHKLFLFQVFKTQDVNR